MIFPTPSKLMPNGHKHTGPATGGSDAAAFVGQVPINGNDGGMILFYGASTDVPPGFAVCNGLNNTPDMTDHFAVVAANDGEVGTVVGDHAAVIDHTHNQGSLAAAAVAHDHPAGNTAPAEWPGNAFRGSANVGGEGASSSATHTHPYQINADGGHGHAIAGSTGGSSVPSIDTRPAFVGLFYIKAVPLSPGAAASGPFNFGWVMGRLVSHTHQAENVRAVPIGGIIMLPGPVGALPPNYGAADGTSGRPNLTEMFVKGIAPGATAGLGGGSNALTAAQLTHTHANASIAGGSGGASAHTGSIAEFSRSADGTGIDLDSGPGGADYNRHAHAVATDTTGAHAHGTLNGAPAAGGPAGVDKTPPYYAAVMAMRLS